MSTDYKKRLVDYVKRNLAKGYTADTLRWALIRQGNSRSVVELAIDEAKRDLDAEAAKVEEPKVEYLDTDNFQSGEEQPKKSFWKRLFGRR